MAVHTCCGCNTTDSCVSRYGLSPRGRWVNGMTVLMARCRGYEVRSMRLNKIIGVGDQRQPWQGWLVRFHSFLALSILSLSHLCLQHSTCLPLHLLPWQHITIHLGCRHCFHNARYSNWDVISVGEYWHPERRERGRGCVCMIRGCNLHPCMGGVRWLDRDGRGGPERLHGSMFLPLHLPNTWHTSKHTPSMSMP